MVNKLGKVLTINLTSGQVVVDSLNEEVIRRYLGGRGLNAWQMGKMVGSEVDALSPENVLLMTCGLMTGTDFPSSSRLQVAARSPLTNLVGTSNVGGYFGAALRRAGYQQVCIVGRAEQPVYIWIDAHGAEIRDASQLWGQSIHATGQALNEGRDARVMAIGEGGENCVRFASIATGDGHTAGRTGLGAVMGSKNLKAIAIATLKAPRGKRNNKNGAALARDYALAIRQSERYATYSTYGNSAYLNKANELGMLGTRNFQVAQYEDADQINGSVLMDYVTRHKTCYRCPVHCRAEVKIKSGRFANLTGERPDIEPLMAFGPRLGVNDPEAVLYLYNLTNTFGIDVISTAGVLAFAFELYEQAILTPEGTGGLVLKWGDVDVIAVLIHQVAQREGLGKILAEGVRKAAKLIGQGSERYAYHSKGLELPGYDPRGAQGAALGFAVSNRGADYTSIYPAQEWFWSKEESKEKLGTEKAVDPLSSEGKGQLVRYAAIVSAVLDALGICKVPVLSVMGDFSLRPEAQLVSALTELDLTSDTLFEIGHRIVNAERRLNMVYGMTHRDDTLPELFLKTPIAEGPAKGITVDLDEMTSSFYTAMGWDDKGNPPEESVL